MKITGLDALSRTLEELEKVLAELDGDLAHVTFNPYDPHSIEQAIHKFNSAVDERLEGYEHNEFVVNIVEEFKENGRSAITDRAAAARLEGEE